MKKIGKGIAFIVISCCLSRIARRLISEPEDIRDKVGEVYAG
jgi:hypothetical protein